MAIVTPPNLRSRGLVKVGGIWTKPTGLSDPSLPPIVVSSGGGTGGNTWIFIGNGISDSVNQITTGLPAPGNLVVIFMKWEGAGLVTGASRGADVFTLGNISTHANNDVHCCFMYFLAASIDPATVVTMTDNGGGVGFQQTMYWIFSAIGTHSVDANPAGASGTGNGTINSSSFSPSVSTGLAMGGYGQYSDNALTVQRIGANAATTVINSVTSFSWDYLFSSSLGSVTANASLANTPTPGPDWVMSAVAFKSL